MLFNQGGSGMRQYLALLGVALSIVVIVLMFVGALVVLYAVQSGGSHAAILPYYCSLGYVGLNGGLC